MSADLPQLRQAVVEHLREHLPDNVTVEAHGGRFDRTELARYSKRAPAVLVAVTSLPAVEEVGAPQPTVQLAAFVVTRDVPQVSRDEQALTLTETLIRHIPGHRWGLDGAQRPARLNAENLYSGTIDRLGIAMWAVSWRQGLTLAPVKDIGELAPFELYTATHRVGGEDDPDTESRAELPQ